MAIYYSSTRGGEKNVTASQAILKGLAEDGGLFMPDTIPVFDRSFSELAKMSYQEVAYEVMKLFLSDFTEEELKDCIARAYDSKFDTEEIAPLVKADGAYYLELFHGNTIAFKDMALSILPRFMTAAARKIRLITRLLFLPLHLVIREKQLWLVLPRWKGPKLLYFTRRTESAAYRNFRC